MNTFNRIAGITVGSILVVAPALAFAQNVQIPTSVGATVQSSISTKAMTHADQEIDRRVNNLNELIARVNTMVKVSTSDKTNFDAALTAQINTLTTLKTQIDSDTTIDSLKADIQSITKNYRIYMLVLPQARIAAASDRVQTIVGQMQDLGAKLQVRITADTGSDVATLQAAYTDMQAKVADANIQATAAVSETASLTPDNGNATVETSNTAAVKDARNKIATATSDLKAARADIKTIINGLHITASATASTTVQ
jgi:hypothetical protein